MQKKQNVQTFEILPEYFVLHVCDALKSLFGQNLKHLRWVRIFYGYYVTCEWSMGFFPALPNFE